VGGAAEEGEVRGGLELGVHDLFIFSGDHGAVRAEARFHESRRF
jgi:hypothetical protein